MLAALTDAALGPAPALVREAAREIAGIMQETAAGAAPLQLRLETYLAVFASRLLDSAPLAPISARKSR